MLRQVGPFGSVQVAMHLLRHLWRDFLLAGLLCALSVPLNPALALKLAPEVLLPIWGIAVSVFVGFRHSQAYERWWEARKLWGALLNHSRKWRDALLALLADEAAAAWRAHCWRRRCSWCGESMPSCAVSLSPTSTGP